MTRPIINIADIELQPRPPAFAATGPAAERQRALLMRWFVLPELLPQSSRREDLQR
jgi:hypothetical protein